MHGIVCPYLGVEDDAETAVAFPSPRNHCYRTQKAVPISISQQDQHCLKSTYATCPIYLLKQTVASQPSPATEKTSPAPEQPKPERKVEPVTPPAERPRPLAAPTPAAPPRPVPAIVKPPAPSPQKPASTRPVTRASRSNRGVKDIILAALAGGGIIAILLASVFIVPASGRLLAADPTPTMIETASTGITETAEAVVLMPTLTKTTQATFTPAPTSTPTRTVTSTAKPTRTKTKAPTGTPDAPPTLTAQPTVCAIPYGWVRYYVRSGDTLSSLSRALNVSIYQLQVANCLGNANLLYAGQAIWVPFIPSPPVQPTVTQTFTTMPSATRANTAVPPTAVPTTPVPPTAIPTEIPTVVVTTEVPTVAPTEVTPPPVENTPTG